ncbi:MAG TPA: hypothetical protein VFI42_02510 [Thermomicrobiaceae bacterium]|nr:hypothetical protein [Thermomicrobiaceae bacterium]
MDDRSSFDEAAHADWAGPRWSPAAVAVAVAVLFLAFSVLMTWPLPAGMAHQLVSDGDPAFQTWTLAWDFHAFTTNPRGVFDANIFYPYHNTLAYSDHLFGQAAVIAPLLAATGNAILADNVSLLLAFAASGFAMYLLVLDLTGNHAAGVVAGFAYAFAPMRLAHIEHLHLISAQWLPLAVLTARRALRGNSGRWAAALGLVVVLQGLFGIYYFYFLIVLLGMVVATFLIWRHGGRDLTAVGKVTLACLVAGAILLPALLPYQTVHDELGIERTLPEVVKWSAQLDNYRAVPPHNRLLGERMGAGHAPDLERQLSPGLLLVPLAVAGLFNRRRSWERWLLLTVAVGSIVLSLGPYWLTHHGREIWLPYRFLYDELPGFRSIRVPARFGLLSLVGLAGLAGLGVDLLCQLARHRRVPDLLSTVTLGLMPVVLLAGLVIDDSTRVPLPPALPTSLAAADAPEYAWMAAHPAPAIEFPMGDGLISSSWSNFWSIFHWNPLVNGYSGIAPPAYYPFRDRMKTFPAPETIRLLQGIGVRTVVYHARSADPAVDAAMLARIRQVPQLHQVVGGPDYVFTLDADPWLLRLAQIVPRGQAVALPELERDPPTFGMLAALLQRDGHRVYGQGRLDYWQLTPAPHSVCYTVLPDGTTPPDANSFAQGGGLTLYYTRGCGV